MEAAADTRDDVWHRRLRTLLRLARSSWAAPSEAGPGLSPVLEEAAALLEADRVGFWRHDEDRGLLRCERLFLRGEGRHVGEGTDELPFAGSPSQEALFQARAWDAHEATRDPLTRDLLGPYLARHRVASMLDAPVRLAGRLAGILRHERVGEPARPFTADDARLAEALADLVALALEAWQRQEAEERLAQASLHDPLTDLPNRRLFLERVDRSLRGLDRRGGGLLAVLSVDVDDPAGTKAGRERDERLLAVAKAITGVLRPADTPARLEGDGFGVLIDRLDEPWEAIAVAERVLSALGRPVAAPGGPLLPAASVGIALADGSHPTSAEGLLHDANLARARARNQGGWRYEVFDTTLRRDVLDRMSLGWALRDALPAGQLVLEYQPERSLHTRRLLELEALLRWDRPGHGRLPAGAFLDLAESSGLIVPIGSWVLREACRRVQGWRRDPRAAHLGVRVNLSARQFERPDLPETVAAALEESGLRAEALCLEITETVLMGNAPAALGILTALKALGVRLAIDDFGTGYSSLAYLKRFPVDTLKIDRSFVEGLGTDPIDLPIVKAVMSLGQTLGLEVVAEGVDRPLQEQTLRALGCDRVQGFLFGRALPPEEVPSLFAVP